MLEEFTDIIYNTKEKNMDFLILILSLAIIVVAADKLIDSSSKIARHYGVPVFIIGISIIAFGTSMPELVVGVISSINGDNALSYGNIVGSCINNMALILGLTAVIITVMVDEKILKKEMLMLTLVEILLLGLSFNGNLSRIDGIILLILGIAFIVYLIKGTKDSAEDDDDAPIEKLPKNEVGKKWFVMLFSLGALIFSGHLIVESSQAIAISFGIDQSAIGLTLIALGTTMPELVTSITAARKKENDIILGNIIGSNIFNILIVLGSAAAINPININFIDTTNLSNSLAVEGGIMIGINIFAYIIMASRKKVSRFSGAMLLLLYAGYMANQILTLPR